MNKVEALKYIKEKQGFIPYVALFEIYKDEDDIPQHLIELSVTPIKPVERLFICSSKIADVLNELLDDV